MRFRDAELVRLSNLDIRERCHRSRDDSVQNEAERTNSAIGDAVVDGSTIEWEVEKRFEGMTPEEIDGMSLNEYEEYEEGRMERNAWMVAEEVQKRVDDTLVLSEYITAYKSQKRRKFFSSMKNICQVIRSAPLTMPERRFQGYATKRKSQISRKFIVSVENCLQILLERYAENTWMVLFVITVQVTTGLGLNYREFLSQFEFRTRPTGLHTFSLFGERLSTMIKANQLNQDLLMTNSLGFRFPGFLSRVL